MTRLPKMVQKEKARTIPSLTKITIIALFGLTALTSASLGEWCDPPYPKHAPRGAFEAATEYSPVYEGPVYICRVNTNRGTRAGFLRLGQGCVYPLRDTGHVETINYQVLCNLKNPRWVMVTHKGEVLDGTVYVGKENSPVYKGEIFVCRVMTRVGLRPGMLRAGDGCVYLRLDNARLKGIGYSALVDK